MRGIRKTFKPAAQNSQRSTGPRLQFPFDAKRIQRFHHKEPPDRSSVFRRISNFPSCSAFLQGYFSCEFLCRKEPRKTSPRCIRCFEKRFHIINKNFLWSIVRSSEFLIQRFDGPQWLTYASELRSLYTKKLVLTVFSLKSVLNRTLKASRCFLDPEYGKSGLDVR